MFWQTSCLDHGLEDEFVSIKNSKNLLCTTVGVCCKVSVSVRQQTQELQCLGNLEQLKLPGKGCSAVPNELKEAGGRGES